MECRRGCLSLAVVHPCACRYDVAIRVCCPTPLPLPSVADLEFLRMKESFFFFFFFLVCARVHF